VFPTGSVSRLYNQGKSYSQRAPSSPVSVRVESVSLRRIVWFAGGPGPQPRRDSAEREVSSEVYYSSSICLSRDRSIASSKLSPVLERDCPGKVVLNCKVYTVSLNTWQYYIKININLPVQLHSFPTSSHILSVTHLFLYSLWLSCHRIGLHWTSDIGHSVLNLFFTLALAVCRSDHDWKIKHDWRHSGNALLSLCRSATMASPIRIHMFEIFFDA
jgi:hypothetical protein